MASRLVFIAANRKFANPACPAHPGSDLADLLAGLNLLLKLARLSDIFGWPFLRIGPRPIEPTASIHRGFGAPIPTSETLEITIGAEFDSPPIHP